MNRHHANERLEPTKLAQVGSKTKQNAKLFTFSCCKHFLLNVPDPVFVEHPLKETTNETMNAHSRREKQGLIHLYSSCLSNMKIISCVRFE